MEKCIRHLFLSFFMAFFSANLYAAATDLVSLYDRGAGENVSKYEKAPGIGINPLDGQITADIVEAKVKGERGLDFVIGRSWAKHFLGTSLMENWELEFPKLVMYTAQSTKLVGDNQLHGICSAGNGDLYTGRSIKNGKNAFIYTLQKKRVYVPEASGTEFSYDDVVEANRRPITLSLPGQGMKVFYPSNGNGMFPSQASYVSEDKWYVSCSDNYNMDKQQSQKGLKVFAPNGDKYFFSYDDRQNIPSFQKYLNIGQTVSLTTLGYVSFWLTSIENRAGERYDIEYNKISQNYTISGYNAYDVMYPKLVKHRLDGKLTENGNSLFKFSYCDKRLGACSDVAIRDANSVFDFNIRKISQFKNGKYIDIVNYGYSKIDGGSVLESASYINKNMVYRYAKIGTLDSEQKYRVIRHDTQFFTHIGVNLVGLSVSSMGQNAYSVDWTYGFFDVLSCASHPKPSNCPVNNPNYNYRLSSSKYTGKDIGSYVINYQYQKPDMVNNIAEVQVSVNSDNVVKQEKYKYRFYNRGLAENILHGKLVAYSSGDGFNFNVNYEYQALTDSFAKTILGVSWEKEAETNISQYVLKEKRITYGNDKYITTFSNFNRYGFPQTVSQTGYTYAGISSYATRQDATKNYQYTYQDLFQDPNNAQYWILGLTNSVTVNGRTVLNQNYDDQGSVVYKREMGVETNYSYEKTSFSSCFSSLLSFKWGEFASCAEQTLFGGYHTGLVYKMIKGTGGEAQVTKFAAYKAGFPQRINMPNGAELEKEYDDDGNELSSKDALGNVSTKVYNDAGEVTKDTSATGIVTNVSRDGLNITKSSKDLTTTEFYDGFGNAIGQQIQAQGTSRYIRKDFDGFGRVLREYAPAANKDAAVVAAAYTYDEFNNVTSITKNGSTNWARYSPSSIEGTISSPSNRETYFLSFAPFEYKYPAAVKNRDKSVIYTTYDLSLNTPLTVRQAVKNAVTGGGINHSIDYQYNMNGQLFKVIDNASGAETYTLDTLGRITSILYADGTTENLSYDALNNVTNRKSQKTENQYSYNVAGQLTFQKSIPDKDVLGANTPATVEETYTRDQFGRVSNYQVDTTPANAAENASSYALKYAYNIYDNVTSVTYPSGKLVDLSNQNALGEVAAVPGIFSVLGYDNAGRLQSVNGQQMQWSRQYYPWGGISSVSYAPNGVCVLGHSYGYDANQRINAITDSCSPKESLTIARDTGGRVSAVTGYINPSTPSAQATVNYKYYDDNIIQVQYQGQSNFSRYNYDFNSSRLKDVVSCTISNIGGWDCLNTLFGFTYDQRGRILSDKKSTFVYDVFGRVVKHNLNNYSYNANGMRVRANRLGEVIDYVYGLNNELLYEYNHKTKKQSNYIYVAGQQLAVIDQYPDVDADKDGILDEDELEMSLNPNDAKDARLDSDGDGVVDWKERLYGLNPNSTDTDGDGYSDSYELEVLGYAAALASNVKPPLSEPEYRKAQCMKTQCWLVPITSLILN